jgi:hypothetical protein
MTTHRHESLRPSWQRREFLLALGALAGCGGGGGGGDVVPAGTKLFDLKFVDAQTAYGVGAQRLIVRTDDGGETWRRLPTASTAKLVSVITTSRQFAVACSDDQAVLRTVDGGANWQTIRQGYGSPVDDPRMGFAPDPDHVALQVEGNVRWGRVNHLTITDNGGVDWRTTVPPGAQIPWEPRFTPSGFLFTLWINSVGPTYPLWVSDDFGRSYRQTPLSGVASGTSGGQGIWVQTSAGDTGNPPATIAMSQDCFKTWTEVPMQVQGFTADAQPTTYVVSLYDGGGGWAVTQQGNTITGLLHTSDGGAHWSAVVPPPEVTGYLVAPAGFLTWTSFDGMGWVGYDNAVAQWFTTDAGVTWRHFDAVSPGLMKQWAMDGSGSVWMLRDGGGGLLVRAGSPLAGYAWLRSMDDGRTWRTLL